MRTRRTKSRHRRKPPPVLSDADRGAGLPEALADGRLKIQLPQGGRLLRDFADELGAALKSKQIFRRGEDVVMPGHQGDCLRVVDPEAFRSWVEDHVVCFYQSFSKQDSEVLQLKVLQTMPVGIARGVLSSHKFIGQLRPLTGWPR